MDSGLAPKRARPGMTAMLMRIKLETDNAYSGSVRRLLNAR